MHNSVASCYYTNLKKTVIVGYAKHSTQTPYKCGSHAIHSSLLLLHSSSHCRRWVFSYPSILYCKLCALKQKCGLRLTIYYSVNISEIPCVVHTSKLLTVTFWTDWFIQRFILSPCPIGSCIQLFVFSFYFFKSVHIHIHVCILKLPSII